MNIDIAILPFVNSVSLPKAFYMDEFVLYIPESIVFTDEQLLALCAQNDHLRIEVDTEQNLTIMSPTGANTGRYNFLLYGAFLNWNNRNQLGYFFDSSTGFRMPDKSVKSPDVSFVKKERFDALSEAEKDGFPPICPDFVLELRSPTDSKKKLLAKMETYLQNGCRLAWLIDPLDQEVSIYRPDQEPQQIEITDAVVLKGEVVLPGFELRLAELFQ